MKRENVCIEINYKVYKVARMHNTTLNDNYYASTQALITVAKFAQHKL